jgi:Flp pilus assembly secretin CpaC
MKAKKLRVLVGGLILLIGGTQPSWSAEKPPLFLKQGEQRFLPLAPKQKYSVSGNSIRYTHLSQQNKLLIKAMAPGIATLITTDGTETHLQSIRVEKVSNSYFSREFLQALNQLEVTEAIDGGTKMILRGEVRTPKEATIIAHLKSHFPQFIVDETTINPSWLEQNKQEIAALLKSHPQVEMQVNDGSILVQGSLPSHNGSVTLQKRIRAIQPLTEFEIQTMTGFSPTLYFKVYLLEVKKEFSSRLGVQITQPFPVQSILSQALTASISAMSERGQVRVLSAPELVVKAPGQAELFAGGELPIRLKSRFNETINWKRIGLALKLDVKEYNGEKVRLHIETELNHQDAALTQENIPGIKTNQLKTMVETRMGKPLLLSGLLQEDTFEQMNGIFGLSEIPVLGKLFGSEDFQKSRSELVAVLLPHREPPREPMQRISSDIPKGPLPIARNYLSTFAIENLQHSKDYPWNAL